MLYLWTEASEILRKLLNNRGIHAKLLAVRQHGRLWSCSNYHHNLGVLQDDLLLIIRLM